MKRACLCLLSVCVLILFGNVINVYAANTAFTTKKLPDERVDDIISNIDLSLLEEEPEKGTITCFDVNNSHLVAVGQDTSDRKIVAVYTNEGVFQYGYSFNCKGSYGLEWDENNLNIYFVRADIIITVSPEAEILSVCVVDDEDPQNAADNNSYCVYLISSTNRTVGDTEYILRSDIGILSAFADSYSRIIVKDITGAENIIYDVNSLQFSKMIFITCLLFVFVSVVVICLVRQFDKMKRDR